MSQWHAKQVLDMGVYGVVWPHVSTVAEARNAVAACRFARPPDSPRYEPAGIRGDGPGRAAAYWGLTADEYYSRAGVWPLDPQGEVMVVIMCEEARGIKNLPQILREVPGIGAVIIGKGDLSQDLGRPRQYDHPAVAGAIDQALAICLEHKVPCGLPGVEVDEVEGLLKKGFRWLMTSPKPSYAALEKGRRLAGR
jgi:4-hydroxy-2-oxoheptanedioate aldolase